MTGRLRDLTINRDRTQNITVTVGADFREQFDKLKDMQIDVEIKPHRAKRSLSANGYAWLLIDKIAAAMNVDKVTVYREAIRSIGGVSAIVCVQDKALDALRDCWEQQGIGWITETLPSKVQGCTNLIMYYGSSHYTTTQMGRLIDHLLQDAQQLGLVIDRPDDLIGYEPQRSE